MKNYILYVVLGFTLLSCKTDKKSTSSDLANTVVIDSIKAESIEEQEKPKSLKEKLIGKIYRKAYEIPEFEKYSSGGFLIGSTFNNEHIVNGKEYTVKIINGINDELLYLVLNEVHTVNNDGKARFKIIDLIELGEFTQNLTQEQMDKLDIFSDVLLNNERAPELIALAEYEEAEVLTKVHKVWRANRKTGKFEEVKDISGITVVNEDF
ncbi:hypothetical protein [Aquimarina longa]|uniref:hypothetical protein n=1 Tax=Aquimarina longa TaxID=1080221 RepID=UPI0011DFB051|nr:hypothetical protein [Aquimarina longa]